MKRCVPILVLHIKLGFCSHQQLVREKKLNVAPRQKSNKLQPSNNYRLMISECTANSTVLIMTCLSAAANYVVHFFLESTRWQRGSLNHYPQTLQVTPTKTLPPRTFSLHSIYEGESHTTPGYPIISFKSEVCSTLFGYRGADREITRVGISVCSKSERFKKGNCK